LLNAPTHLRDNPLAKVYIIDHLNPGATIRRRIRVENTAPAVMHADVYPAAATIEDHTFKVADGQTGNELTSWVTVNHTSLDLPADGGATVEVTVAVPARASSGERYGVLWAQTNSAANASTGVTQISRVGIRLYLDIGPGGDPPCSFTITNLTASRTPDGTPSIIATVRNTGGRALDLGGSLILSDGPAAIRAGPFPVTKGTTLAIGDTGPITVMLDKHLPNGPWTAHLNLRSGFATQDIATTVTFPDPGKTGNSVSLISHTWAITLGLSATVAVLIALGLVFFLRHRSEPSRGGLRG
jgi:hypothetical protein